MLRHLRVTNFAILSDVAVDLGPGLNVLTGETGAGKSLIVEAVNLLRGGRASADIPRAGAAEAVVEAIFEVPDDLRERIAAVLREAGIEGADDEVLIRRIIQKGGRSRTYVNGVLTTATRLAELGALLVDLSGQHQHQGLVDPRRHREILDLFAAEPKLGAEMTVAWEALSEVEAQLAELGGDERARRDRAEYLRFQVEELDGARLAPGEDEALEVERVRLAAVDQLQAGARLAEELVYGGEDAASDRLGAAAREVEKLARLDASLDPCARQIAEARVLADDAAATLRHYADRLEGDPARLAEVDDRLALLRRLVRKHGAGDLADLIARAAALRAELDGLDNRDERLAAGSAAVRRARPARSSAPTGCSYDSTPNGRSRSASASAMSALQAQLASARSSTSGPRIWRASLAVATSWAGPRPSFSLTSRKP
jgi:DNA repair protein RecN (Recombination protein N)